MIAKAYLKENLEKGTVFLLYFNDAVSDKEVCELIMDIPRRLNRFLEAYFAKLYAEKNFRRQLSNVKPNVFRFTESIYYVSTFARIQGVFQ